MARTVAGSFYALLAELDPALVATIGYLAARQGRYTLGRILYPDGSTETIRRPDLI